MSLSVPQLIVRFRTRGSTTPDTKEAEGISGLSETVVAYIASANPECVFSLDNDLGTRRALLARINGYLDSAGVPAHDKLYYTVLYLGPREDTIYGSLVDEMEAYNSFVSNSSTLEEQCANIASEIDGPIECIPSSDMHYHHHLPGWRASKSKITRIPDPQILLV
jgi:hypothetical protein